MFNISRRSNFTIKLFSFTTLFVICFTHVAVAAEVFTVDMTVGTTHPQVKALQQFLNLDTRTRVASVEAGSPGYETEYFGGKTSDAVKRFQTLYSADILEPLGLTAPTGYVGRATRQVLNYVANVIGFTANASVAYLQSNNDARSQYQYQNLVAQGQNVAGNANSVEGRTIYVTNNVTNVYPSSASSSTTPPTLVSAEANATTLIVTYNKNLDSNSIPNAADFIVTANSVNKGVSSVSVDGSSVMLRLTASVGVRTTVLLSYTPGANPIQDLAGNDAVALSGRVVNNTTVATVAVVPTTQTPTTTPEEEPEEEGGGEEGGGGGGEGGGEEGEGEDKKNSILDLLKQLGTMLLAQKLLGSLFGQVANSPITNFNGTVGPGIQCTCGDHAGDTLFTIIPLGAGGASASTGTGAPGANALTSAAGSGGVSASAGAIGASAATGGATATAAGGTVGSVDPNGRTVLNPEYDVGQNGRYMEKGIGNPLNAIKGIFGGSGSGSSGASSGSGGGILSSLGSMFGLSTAGGNMFGGAGGTIGMPRALFYKPGVGGPLGVGGIPKPVPGAWIIGRYAPVPGMCMVYVGTNCVPKGPGQGLMVQYNIGFGAAAASAATPTAPAGTEPNDAMNSTGNGMGDFQPIQGEGANAGKFDFTNKTSNGANPFYSTNKTQDLTNQFKAVTPSSGSESQWNATNPNEI